MRRDIVLTLSGKDRVGIVEEVTKALLDIDGNVETSRMSRLGGAFAILMLVSLPTERVADVEPALRHLIEEGYTLTTCPTEPAADTHAGWPRYRIDVRGADHEGIVHGIARELSQREISIESVETGTAEAPMSACPLFSMTAIVVVPPGLPERQWADELAEVAHLANVDMTVERAESE